MGRHNTIAGRMADSANARGKLFTKLTREIYVAARQSPDLETNAALRTAVAKAKQNSMPKDVIERAIKKASGTLEAEFYETAVYEAYMPGGGAIVIDVLTSNKQRTMPEIKQIVHKNGGNLAEIGAVAWQFKKYSIFICSAIQTQENYSWEPVMEAIMGLDITDIIQEDNAVIVYAPPENYAELSQQLSDTIAPFQAHITKSSIGLVPENWVDIPPEQQPSCQKILDLLEDHDDVQDVYKNF
jgi:YebC/PmpR family DNA-binding regulatory protein